MKLTALFLRFVLVCAIATLLLGMASIRAGTATTRWVAAWAAAPQGPLPIGLAANPSAVLSSGQASDQTFRFIIRASAGGGRVRIHLSNLYGTQPVTFAAASLARSAGAGRLAAPIRRLSFRGHPSVTIPPGGDSASDAVSLPVTSQEDLAVSLAVVGRSGPITWHAAAFATAYLSAVGAGDHVMEAGVAALNQHTGSIFWLDAVDVASSAERGALVVVGDSITDGFGSDFDRNDRWTDILAQRLARLPSGSRLSVVRAAIGGNTITHTGNTCLACGAAAVDRLNRDVLAQAGVTDVILYEGINDVSNGASAAAIIDGMRSIASRAHARGLRIVGATLLPNDHYAFPGGQGAAKERVREAVNQWIRASGIFDAVIDFDRALRDPRHPELLEPRYDSGDGLHPSTAGHLAMGNAVSLAIFQPTTPTRS